MFLIIEGMGDFLIYTNSNDKYWTPRSCRGPLAVRIIGMDGGRAGERDDRMRHLKGTLTNVTSIGREGGKVRCFLTIE
jgi:hypothetical protein